MSTDPQNEKPAQNPGEASWLMQFYTPSKTTIQTEFSESAETGPESPASKLSTLPGEKYEITDELGTGGMKLVRRTHDRNAARDVALAVLLDPNARSKKISRFVREARITAALEHPNIVPIYDIGVDEAGKPYFTMKLLGGETLHSILQHLGEGDAEYRKRYPLNRLLQIFLGVCNAVSFAHSRGVIHLDLKPANIQVGDFGEVLVLDWGLAKVIEKDPAHFPHRLVLGEGLREIPKEGVVRGTPGFMGPEQSRGEYASLNEHTDIFALGAVLYTILKCRPPSKKADAQQKGGPAPGFKIPTALEAVTTKAMARQPVNRYQTVGELAGDVQAFLDGHATKAQQAGAFTLLWLLIKRHNVVTSLLCLSLVLVFSILSGALIRIHHSEQQVRQALQRNEEEAKTKQALEVLAAPGVLQKAEDAIHLVDYDTALSHLEYAVTLFGDSDSHQAMQAWWELGALHLGREEFEQANLAFEHVGKFPAGNGKDNSAAMLDLPVIAKAYAATARENNGNLPREKQAELANAILHAERTAWQYRQNCLGAFFKSHNRNIETANFELIEQMLRAMNSDSKNLEFSHEITEAGLKVSIHGEKINTILPLTGLPITYLDVSGIQSLSMDWMRDAPLAVVDFSYCNNVDLIPLNKIPTLGELRLVNTRDKDYPRIRSMSQLKRVVVSVAELPAARREIYSRTHTPPVIIGE